MFFRLMFSPRNLLIACTLAVMCQVQVTSAGDSKEEKILTDREERRKFLENILNPGFEEAADKIMICGKSGSGKSALTALMVEPNVGEESGFYLVKDRGKRLRLYGTIPLDRYVNSGNQCFQISADPGPGTVESIGLSDARGSQYWDCPGFYNPTGDVEEILHAVRFRQLVSKGKIKFLLVVQKAEIQDRLTDVVDIYKRLVRMFSDEQRLFESTQLIVSRFSPDEIVGDDDFRVIVQENTENTQKLRRIFAADAEDPGIARRAMHLHQLLVQQMGLFPSPDSNTRVGKRYDPGSYRKGDIEALLEEKTFQSWPDAFLSVGERASSFLQTVCEKWVKDFCETIAIKMYIPEKITQESFKGEVWGKFTLLEELRKGNRKNFLEDIRGFLAPETAEELLEICDYLNRLNDLVGYSIRGFDDFVLGQKNDIIKRFEDSINLEDIALQLATYIKAFIHFDQLKRSVFWDPILKWDDETDIYKRLEAKIQRIQRGEKEELDEIVFLDTSSEKEGWNSNFRHLSLYTDKIAALPPEQQEEIFQRFDFEVILSDMNQAWEKGKKERRLISEIRRNYPKASYQNWKKFRHRNFHYSLGVYEKKLCNEKEEKEVRVDNAVVKHNFTTLPMFESFLMRIGLGADGLFEDEEKNSPLNKIDVVRTPRDIRDLRIVIAQQEGISTLDQCHSILSIPLYIGIPPHIGIPRENTDLLSIWITPKFFRGDSDEKTEELITVIAKYRIPKLNFAGQDKIPSDLTYEDIQKVSQGLLTITASLHDEPKSCTSFTELFSRDTETMREFLSLIEKKINPAYDSISSQLQAFDTYRETVNTHWQAVKSFIPELTGAGGAIGGEAIAAAARFYGLLYAPTLGSVMLPVATIASVVSGIIKRNDICEEIKRAGDRCNEVRVELERVRNFTLPLLQSWNDCRLKFAPDISLSIESDKKQANLLPSQLFADIVQLSEVDIRNREADIVRIQAGLLSKRS